MAVNLYGPMCAMRKAVNVFLEQGDGGAILNVASIGAMRTVVGPIYCASKAGLVAMSKNTAFMYLPNKIRCNVIAQGDINTEISSSMGAPSMNGYFRVEKVLASSPEVGEATDIANADLFLMSDESSYISGDVLIVDGG
jgi:NAD(P)-dependent dehydrogenase (short-subunit alcohol dehydrogenase family)